jgi:predicted MFS family arabinose efflux permease
MCAGLVLFTATTALPATLSGALLSAFGGSFVVMVSATLLIDRHGEGGPAAVAEANALAAGVGTVAPLVVGLSVGLGFGWRPAVLLLLPVVGALVIAGRGVRAPRHTDPGEERRGRLPRRYWISWMVVTSGIAIEFCLVLWTADVMRERVGLSPGPAAASVTAVVGGMFVGRLLGGRLALRYPLDGLLYGAIALTGTGFTVLWLTTEVSLALPALLACGIGIALFYPLGVARAIDASEGRPDHASARVGIGAALASGLGPFVLGALADLFGLHLALLVVPALLAVAALGLHLGRLPSPATTTATA